MKPSQRVAQNAARQVDPPYVEISQQLRMRTKPDQPAPTVNQQRIA